MIKAITFDLDGVYFTSDSFQKFKDSLPKKETDPEKINWALYKSPEKLGINAFVYQGFEDFQAKVTSLITG